ncbi:hypothetical protein OOU_Y34scaffold00519g26 [Pyricularia oryzae Y34]|uniref:Uncharacterized protein n=2 Tax=Pyricularia oryzae TaxID=318829 RepID=A0AA97PLF4_PYRO3|nr:hypothetical protein OOU_Y34scaffold00519g26 [Pyricularia oryzae Y34]
MVAAVASHNDFRLAERIIQASIALPGVHG